jgi:alpha-L-fucosidase
VTRLRTIGAWLKINGDAIYGTRPWERFGEGPTKVKEGNYVADHSSDFLPEDLRFTTRGPAFYVHVMGAPGATVLVGSIRKDTALPSGPVKSARILGLAESLRWEWSPDGLVLHMPEQRPSNDALVIQLS